MKKHFLSSYTLSIYRECPRCFWHHVRKGKTFQRPEPPISTLPRGMDALIKEYFDQYRRAHTLPPELMSVSSGRLVEQQRMDAWRSWKTGLQYCRSDGHRLIGALDECLIEDGRYVPVDYKTRGFALRDNSASYYVFQMSCYRFLLEKNGYPARDHAILVFYIPARVGDGGNVEFHRRAVRVETQPVDVTNAVFEDALSVLSGEQAPAPSDSCTFCAWAAKVASSPDPQMKLF
ncbi:MAG: hypothetical protein GF333_02475 [Candidatus Omnitrophica bacterium]|nr:hypothetical protein [Candidatus Omnitrophota bacterium]